MTRIYLTDVFQWKSTYKIKTSLYTSTVSLAVLLLMSFIVGYKILPSSTWLSSSTSQYQENIEISTTLFLEPPVTTEIPPLKGFIIYDCDNEHAGPCGGWSERIAGIFSSYVISVLLRKHFLIKYTRPFNLTDYLVPNTFDWKYNSSILPGRSWDYQDFFSKTPNALKKDYVKGLNDLFPYDVNFVRMSWDYTEYFRHFQSLPNVIPWVLELHFADIYLKFFNTLFQPSKIISQTVNSVVRNVTKLACAHISLGERRTISAEYAFTNKEQIEPIWNLLRAMEMRNYSIFVATDSQFVQNTAKTRFKNLLEVEGRILQMDRPVGGDGVAGGYKKIVADFLVLTKCDVLILTKSGFGMLAAYMNNKTKELYCLKSDEVLPCSRYTIHSFYPEKIFSPVQ